jgi:hypothetical protein
MRAGRMAQVVEFLPSKGGVLRSNPSTEKKKKRLLNNNEKPPMISH